MTANPATHPAMFVLEGKSSSCPDPVRSRICAGQQRTHSEDLQAFSTDTEDALAGQRALHRLGETRGTGPRGPHLGDILYWAACLGGACLLLIAATT